MYLRIPLLLPLYLNFVLPINRLLKPKALLDFIEALVLLYLQSFQQICVISRTFLVYVGIVDHFLPSSMLFFFNTNFYINFPTEAMNLANALPLGIGVLQVI
jgi:Na+-transporting methylmalonyl-CoA/oxaloacetate decarboxylase beta subunit